MQRKDEIMTDCNDLLTVLKSLKTMSILSPKIDLNEETTLRPNYEFGSVQFGYYSHLN